MLFNILDNFNELVFSKANGTELASDEILGSWEATQQSIEDFSTAFTLYMSQILERLEEEQLNAISSLSADLIRNILIFLILVIFFIFSYYVLWLYPSITKLNNDVAHSFHLEGLFLFEPVDLDHNQNAEHDSNQCHPQHKQHKELLDKFMEELKSPSIVHMPNLSFPTHLLVFFLPFSHHLNPSA